MVFKLTIMLFFAKKKKKEKVVDGTPGMEEPRPFTLAIVEESRVLLALFQTAFFSLFLVHTDLNKVVILRTFELNSLNICPPSSEKCCNVKNAKDLLF